MARQSSKNVYRFACLFLCENRIMRFQYRELDTSILENRIMRLQCVCTVAECKHVHRRTRELHASRCVLLLTLLCQAACFALGNLVAAYPPAQMMVDEYHGIEALLKIIPCVRILRSSPPQHQLQDASRESMEIREIPASNFPPKKCREFLGLVPLPRITCANSYAACHTTQPARNLSKRPKH
jgi:hypothetical protein